MSVSAKKAYHAQIEKPKALTGKWENIPNELKKLPHWIVWDFDWRESAWSKMPYKTIAPRQRLAAKSNDLSTWSTFEAAVLASGFGMSGIGFVFSGGDAFCGIDLDDCRDPASGQISPEAQKIIDDLGTYSEISPSGTGVKLICKAKLPGKGRNWPILGVEIYDQLKFFALTGHRIGQVATCESRQAQVDSLITWATAQAVARQSVSPSSPSRPASTSRPDVIARARAYLKRVPVAISGQNGHGQCFHVAMILVEGFGLTDTIAFAAAIADWNASCSPSWSERNLEHKHRSALGKADPAKIGYLLREDRNGHAQNRTNRHTSNGTAGNNGKPHGNGQAKAEPAKPKIRVPEPFEPFPTQALPEPFRRFVVEGAASIGCDPTYLALPGMSVLASAIGNTRTLRLKRGWDEPSVVWTAIVGDSGTLKSPAFRAAIRPLYAAQRKRIDEHKRRFREYKESGSSDDPPVLERCVCSDVTIEKLAELLQDSPRGLMVERDELAGWLGSFMRYKSAGVGSDLPKWLEAFNAGHWALDRRTGERRTVHVDRAAVSVSGSIQPGILRRLLSEAFFDSGLVARILMTMPPKLPKQWSENEISETTRDAYEGLVNTLLNLPFGRDSEGQERPYVLHLSGPAKEEWKTFYGEWAAMQTAVEGEHAAALSKLEGYAARLTLLHHVVSHIGVHEDDRRSVGDKSVQAGVELTRWFARETGRIYGAISESSADGETRKLIEFIRQHSGRISTRQLRESNRSRYETAEQAEQRLQELIDAKLGEWEEVPTTPKGGRPSKVFSLIILGAKPTKPTKPPHGDAWEGEDDTHETTPV